MNIGSVLHIPSRVDRRIMDPSAIATTSLRLVQLCNKTKKSLSYVTSKIVAPLIAALASEIASLSQALNTISESFNIPFLANAALSSQCGREHWQNVLQAMEDCKETLTSLEWRLEEVEDSTKGLFAFTKNPENLHSTESSFLELQIGTYREAMQLSLQLMVLYMSLFVIYLPVA